MQSAGNTEAYFIVCTEPYMHNTALIFRYIFLFLQVTCPLLTFAIRDMALKMFNIDPTEHAQRWLVLFILLCVTPVALCLSGNFAALCSVIGSFATVTNSIILPVVFYHSVHTGQVGVGVSIAHGVIMVLAVASAVVGMYANFGKYLF